MSSAITQTPITLFQNMLLQHVHFHLLKSAKHPSLSQRSGQWNPTIKISEWSIPKRRRGREERKELGLMNLLCFNLECKRASQQVHTKHINLLFTVTRYYVLMHMQNWSIFFFMFYTSMWRHKHRNALFLDPFQVSMWFRYWAALHCPY